MKLAIDTSVVSSKTLATFVGLLAAASVSIGWPLNTGLGRAIVALIGVALGTVLVVKQFWLVRHPAPLVLEQIQGTLRLSGIAYDVSAQSVKVRSTGTQAHVRSAGPLSVVTFDVIDGKCNKERFLLEVLTKYLRFTGKKDANE